MGSEVAVFSHHERCEQQLHANTRSRPRGLSQEPKHAAHSGLLRQQELPHRSESGQPISSRLQGSDGITSGHEDLP